MDNTNTALPTSQTVYLRAKCPRCGFDLNDLPDLELSQRDGLRIGEFDNGHDRGAGAWITVCDSCCEPFAVARRAVLNLRGTIDLLIGEAKG